MSADIAMSGVLGSAVDDDDESSASTSSVAAAEGLTTLPPSHIAHDGTFVNLPAPTDAERIRFFERAIAEHGLLQDDLKDAPDDSKIGAVGGTKEKVEDKKSSEPKIHPLALASARLQTNGINELNRAINLHTLVASGDYFTLSNIVDPSLELGTTEKAATGNQGAGGSAASGAAATAKQPVLDEEEGRTKASYILKRKRVQFEQAASTLKRHRSRLSAAIVAQTRPDERLRELRPVWRLVAPEHGTRALPHAALPTEVVGADADVYDNRNVGRLASRVPRYATLELKEDYKGEDDLDDWKQRHFLTERSPEPMDIEKEGSSDVSDDTPIASNMDRAELEAEEPRKKEAARTREKETKNSSKASPKVSSARQKESSLSTRAEPFAIADPSLGKIDTDFDPTKVVMLTLQFDIEKPSTGFSQRACLEPMVSSADQVKSRRKEDEDLLVALQHSLFCAKLFEAVRRELAPDTEEIGQVRTAKTQSAVWLSGESEENFLPPPSLMMSNNTGGHDSGTGLAPLCVVHVHEGDVKVLLDCEYSLRVRLVESASINYGRGGKTESSESPSDETLTKHSGSQSPGQLLSLCRALLLHAQETYHQHSVETETELRNEREEEEKRIALLQKENPRMKIFPQLRSKDSVYSPRILQSCVCLGTKLLFEKRMRRTLRKVNDWLKVSASQDASLTIEWLSLSMFDLSAQFLVSFRSWSIDANIVGDELTVTSFDGSGNYRKATFHTDQEFELYLKLALQRVI